MPKKIIKDVFLREKEDATPLREELRMYGKNKSKFFLRFIIVVVGIILFSGFGWIILGKISSGTISIIPHNEYLEINSDLKAYANPSVGGLAFEIMQLDANETQPVIATGMSGSGQKASGKIIIYNNYSSVSQKLIATTRFETKDGKIYRIPESVVVPGMGSVEATVYADKPGEEYNVALTDFTVPGLKGGPRYEKVYARSKTEIKGGSSGNTKIVREEDLTSAKEEATKKIKKKLLDTFSKQKPNGFMLYDGGIKIEYMEDPSNPKSGDSASGPMLFKAKGIALGYLMKKDDLSRVLLGNNAKKLSRALTESDEITLSNLEDLKMEIISVSQQNKEMAFNMTGKARFVWGFDSDKLAKDLSVYKGKDYNSVFQNYTSIEKASVAIKPSWWGRLPSKSSKIKINTVLQ